MRHGTALSSALLTFCMGCATARLATPSGRPEVTIAAPIAQIKPVLINDLVNRHFLVIQDSPAMVVADGDAGAWLDFWFVNTLTGEKPRIRNRFNLIEEGGSTRIVGSVSMTSAAGFSGRASEEEFPNQKPLVDLQYFLDCVAANVSHQPRPSAPPEPKIQPAKTPKGG